MNLLVGYLQEMLLVISSLTVMSEEAYPSFQFSISLRTVLIVEPFKHSLPGVKKNMVLKTLKNKSLSLVL